MKITTWNVNGYRACWEKGFYEWFNKQNSDVVCLQEIKTKPEQLTDQQKELPGYSSVWNPAERPGYSGVATFFRQMQPNIRTGIGVPRFDQEGRVIQMVHRDFRLFNIYFPNGQRGLDRLSFKLDFYSHLFELCNDLMRQGERIIITGDFNIAHKEIDLAHPKENEKNSGFLPEERQWIDKFLESGFVDIYRDLYPQKIQYTWWTYISKARSRNIGWRLDYFLVTRPLVPNITDVIIHDDIPGSDHCPVSLIMKD